MDLDFKVQNHVVNFLTSVNYHLNGRDMFWDRERLAGAFAMTFD
jgi:hypothetical protein